MGSVDGVCHLYMSISASSIRLEGSRAWQQEGCLYGEGVLVMRGGLEYIERVCEGSRAWQQVGCLYGEGVLVLREYVSMEKGCVNIERMC